MTAFLRRAGRSGAKACSSVTLQRSIPLIAVSCGDDILSCPLRAKLDRRSNRPGLSYRRRPCVRQMLPRSRYGSIGGCRINPGKSESDFAGNCEVAHRLATDSIHLTRPEYRLRQVISCAPRTFFFLAPLSITSIDGRTVAPNPGL